MASVDQEGDSSDEDVWSSMPTLDEPPKKSKCYKNHSVHKHIVIFRVQKIFQTLNCAYTYILYIN